MRRTGRLPAVFSAGCSGDRTVTASPPLWAVWTDVLWCLGIGLCIAGGRDVLGLLLGESRPVRLVLDLAGFSVAAVAVCGFAAQASASGTTRWYMAAAMAVGALGWQKTVSPVLHRGMACFLRLLVLPLHLMEQLILRPAGKRLMQTLSAVKKGYLHRKQVKKRKKRKKMLQNPKRILYN